MRSVFSVSQLNRYIRGMFAEDHLLRSVMVRGEVSGCKYHSSGHIYFTLKDASGTLPCVMFASRRRGLSFRMKDGDQVVVSGSVDVYERDGRYQLYAEKITPEGAGLLYEKYEQLKKRLEEAGMFDEAYKQPVPKYIRTLGVVTAPTGAAVRDIINITARRNPYVQIILYPAIVQGEAAPDSIISGIRALEQFGVDVMIIGRGGGSIEDLWAFNEERVAEAVFNCSVPVISAVGHETDTVITDYVADLRAPTPSAAAELAVFDHSQFIKELTGYRDRMEQSLNHRIRLMRRQSEAYMRELRLRSPEAGIRDRRLLLDRFSQQLQQSMDIRIAELRREADVGERLTQSMERRIIASRHRIELFAAELSSRSPLQRLSGGYGFIRDEAGRSVRSVSAVQPGKLLRISLRDGEIESRAVNIREWAEDDALNTRDHTQ